MEPLNITTYVGVGFADRLSLELDGVAYDLTGATATANLFNGSPDNPGSVALSLTTANGRLAVVSPATDGNLNRTILPAVAAGLDAGDYWWELTVTKSGRVDRPAFGYWQHLPTGITTSTATPRLLEDGTGRILEDGAVRELEAAAVPSSRFLESGVDRALEDGTVRTLEA